MASEFQNTASAHADDQKRALLAAVAEQGTAGRQAYERASTVVDPLRQQAMAQAANAAVPGAQAAGFSTAQGAHGQGFMGGPNDALSTIQASLAQSRMLQEQDTARQAAAGEQYFSQLQGALPFVDQETQAQIREIAAARSESEADRAYKLKSRDLDTKQLSLAERKYAKEEELLGAQDAFRETMVTKVGPKTRKAFDFFASAGDLATALSDLAASTPEGWLTLGIDDQRTKDDVEELLRAYFAGKALPSSYNHDGGNKQPLLRPGIN